MLSWLVWAGPILIPSVKFLLPEETGCSWSSVSQWHILPSKGWGTILSQCFWHKSLLISDWLHAKIMSYIKQRETWTRAYLYFNSTWIPFCLTWIALSEVFINLKIIARYREKISILTLTYSLVQQDLKIAGCLLTTVKCSGTEKLWEEFAIV